MKDKAQAINCTFNSENALYLSYMPFIVGGGLFIRTKNLYQVGSSVQLTIQLMDEPEPFLIEGKVVWLTSKGAQGNKPMGIGVQFVGEPNRALCNKIETYLAGMLKSTQPTDTI